MVVFTVTLMQCDGEENLSGIYSTSTKAIERARNLNAVTKETYHVRAYEVDSGEWVRWPYPGEGKGPQS